MTQADQQNSESAVQAKTKTVRKLSFHSCPDCTLFAKVNPDLKQYATGRSHLRGKKSQFLNLGFPWTHTSVRSYLLRDIHTTW